MAASASAAARSAMKNILVVGGGLTSASFCSQLSEAVASSSSSLQLSVWDKARGSGGRMSSSRRPRSPSHPEEDDCSVDLGAQYISASPEYADQHKSFYDALLSANVLAPLTGRIDGMRGQDGFQHFVVPKGSSDLVKHFFRQSQAQINFGRHVTKLNLTEDKKWAVSTKQDADNDDSPPAHFDAVILTLPVEQVLNLDGDVKDVLSASVSDELAKVEYSSRFALGLFFDEQVDLGAGQGQGQGAVARYITDDPIIRFASVDTLKRGLGSGPSSVVLHTSADFGRSQLEKTPGQVEPILLSKAKQLFPHWPEPSHVKCHKWRYSQVTRPYAGQPGCLILNEDPLLVIGGDAFTHSNFDGCVGSAEKMAQIVARKIRETNASEI